MRFFGLKTCDTCRKALVELRAAGHDPEVIDVRNDGIQPDDLKVIVAIFGADAVNRSSATWRTLSEDERTLRTDLLIARHPVVMKRPVIEDDGHWHIGWTAATQAALTRRDTNN